MLNKLRVLSLGRRIGGLAMVLVAPSLGIGIPMAYTARIEELARELRIQVLLHEHQPTAAPKDVTELEIRVLREKIEKLLGEYEQIAPGERARLVALAVLLGAALTYLLVGMADRTLSAIVSELTLGPHQVSGAGARSRLRQVRRWPRQLRVRRRARSRRRRWGNR